MKRKIEIATIGIGITIAAQTLFLAEQLPIPPDGRDKPHHAIAWAGDLLADLLGATDG